ncbi:MAG: MMPL family transporter [Acidimicrobiales bacterium]
MSSVLYRLGRWSAGRPWTVIGLWAAAAALVLASSAAFGRAMEDSFEVPGVDSQQAVDVLSSAASDRAGITARVVAAPEGGAAFADAPGAEAALRQLRADLAGLPKVLDVSEARSPDGRVALLTVQYPVLADMRADDLDPLKEVLADTGRAGVLQAEAGGELFFNFEEPAGSSAELIGLGAAVVILLVAFGSVVAMGLPIVIALFGLALGVAAMPLISHLVMIPSWAPQMGSMIGLGVGIDYALFLVTRHRELLARGLPVPEAAGRAVATAGQAVVFAGGTVVIAILGLSVAGLPFMTAAAVATAVIVALMVTSSVTLLPALLGLVGPWINRLGLHRSGHRVNAGPTPGWRRWGRHLGRHPWVYTVGVTAVLVALTAPVLSLRLGFPDDGTAPGSRTERRAYDLAAGGFGPGVNGPLVIAVDLGGDDVAVVEPLAAAVAADPGIAAVAPPEVNAGAGVATIVALPTTKPQDDATWATVERLRADVLPAVLDGTGAEAHVGGQTATFGDAASRIGDRLPWFVGAVVVLSFLLLMVVFRSVLVPLKAAVLNLLSIGAAYGVLVVVFQWGWGKELIGLETTVPIVSFLPMFMFAVLFGLSMDYEVFLLSRVREEYAATGDNDEAVVAGLAGTARVITSAALIMISVFAGFVLGDDPIVKMLGLGLAVAILVDATVIRVVLVPATMTLLGRANWWLPGWLDRVLPAIDIDGGDTGGPDSTEEDRLAPTGAGVRARVPAASPAAEL